MLGKAKAKLVFALACTTIAVKKSKTKMGKRVRITNDKLNSYGTRVLTAGMDVGQYKRNPVLLYMHGRGNVIGYIKDIEVKNGEVTGEPVFDCASELSTRCKTQWEFGSLKMVSAGLDVIAFDDSPDLLVPGQTSPTISKSKLFEVSIVDIGANDDAIQLTQNGKIITLGKGSECPLPLLNNTTQKKVEEMETKTIALQLGLAETATDAEISAKLAELKAAKAESEKLKEANDQLVLAQITSLVEQAVADKRLSEDKKAQFVELGKKVGAKDLKATLEAMSPQVRLSAVIGHHGGAPAVMPAGKATYAKLSEVPEGEIATLRAQTPAEYKRLYKAEYGMDCEL